MGLESITDDVLMERFAPVVKLIGKARPSLTDVEPTARKMHLPGSYTVGNETFSIQEAVNLLRQRELIAFSTNIPYTSAGANVPMKRMGYCLPEQAAEYAGVSQE